MSSTRRRVGPISALTASLLLSGAAIIGANLVQRDGAPGRLGVLPAYATVSPPAAGLLPAYATVSPPAAGLLPAYATVSPPAAGVLPDSASLNEPLPSGKIGTATGPVKVRYTFDGGVDHPITDTQGAHELRPLGQNGGTLSLVPQGLGLAVEYPQRCTLVRERDCPRTILEGWRDDSLNPGARPLQYGASVLMTHADLSDGANVFQKGYSVGGVSQFKLQVDHRQGHPSCVITGNRAHIYRAEPRLDVADGSWHSLSCVRSANRLAILVDGAERASVA